MKFLIAVIFTFSLLISDISPVLAMRCNGKVVSVGDLKSDVIAKCGNPTFSNIISFETKEETFGNKINTVETPVEQMTYNQGPNTFLKILTFKEGKLIKIEDGEKVSDDDGSRDRFTASIGDPQAEIYAKYGAPSFKEVISIESTETLSEDQGERAASSQKISEIVEQWTYNFAPGTFSKILTFKNGKLTKIEDGLRQ